MWLVVKVGVLPRARGGRGAAALLPGAAAGVGVAGAASWAKMKSGASKNAERKNARRGVFMVEAGNGF
jgi:hypothetical protein